MLVSQGGKKFTMVLKFKNEDDAKNFKIDNTPMDMIFQKGMVASNMIDYAESYSVTSIGENVILMADFDDEEKFTSLMVYFENELANSLEQSTPLLGDVEVEFIDLKITGANDEYKSHASLDQKRFTSKANLKKSTLNLLKEALTKTYTSTQVTIYEEEENDIHKFITKEEKVNYSWTNYTEEYLLGVFSESFGRLPGYMFNEFKMTNIKTYLSAFVVNKKSLTSTGIKILDQFIQEVKKGLLPNFYMKNGRLLCEKIKENEDCVIFESVWKTKDPYKTYLNDFAYVGKALGIKNPYETFGLSPNEATEMPDAKYEIIFQTFEKLWTLFREENKKYQAMDANIISEELFEQGALIPFTQVDNLYNWKKYESEVQAAQSKKLSSYIRITQSSDSNNLRLTSEGITDTDATSSFKNKRVNLEFDGIMETTYMINASADSL